MDRESATEVGAEVTTPSPVAQAMADASPTPWKEAQDRLENPQQAQTYWLSTVRPDGRPHVMPLIGLWVDDAFYFISGKNTRKARNLAQNPHCVISCGSRVLPSLDIVIEGEARPVSSSAKLTSVAEHYRAKMGWPLEVRGGELFGPNAPTAGPPPYTAFKVSPTTVYGLPGLEGMDKAESVGSIHPTRWRFD
jgi:hypothetical protein